MKGHDTTENKVSIKEQIGYFCGDFGGSLVNLYISAFYLTFCTYKKSPYQGATAYYEYLTERYP